MSEPIVAMEFGGCLDDDASRQEAMQLTHDNLIRHYPVRLGPVVWHFYAGSQAQEKLRLAGIADDRGLIGWLARNPSALLIIASVTVPKAAARLPDRLTTESILGRMS